MTFDYNKEHKTSMSLVLENGISVEGEFIDLRNNSRYPAKREAVVSDTSQ